MWTRLLERIVEGSARRPFRVVALAGLVAALAGAASARLEFRGDFTELLPEDTVEVRDFREVEARSGGSGYLIVQVLGGTREARRAFAREAAAALEAQPQLVRFVEWRVDTEFFARRALLLMETERLEALRDELVARLAYERAVANPLYVDLGEAPPPLTFEALEAKYAPARPPGEFLESKDGRELYLLVRPTRSPSDLDFNRRLVPAVEAALRPLLERAAGLELHLCGGAVTRLEEDDQMKSDLQRSVLLAALVTMGIMLAVSRRVAVLVVVALPVGIGVAATYAFAWIRIGHFNPVTGFLAAVLIGLGMEFGLHLAMRYWEERRRAGPVEAMATTVQATAGGAVASALTNGAAFLVLVFAEFAAFRQFGELAAFGVLATMIATYALAPALLFLSERFALRPVPPPRPDAPEASLPRAPTWLLVSVAVGTAACALASSLVAREVGFETDLLRLRGDAPAVLREIHVSENLGMVMLPAVLWVEDGAAAQEAVAAARALQREGGGADRGIAHVASLEDFVPHDVERRMAVLAELRRELERLPASRREDERVQRVARLVEAEPWGRGEVPLELRRRFEPTDGRGELVLVFPEVGLHDMRRLRTWAGALDELVARAAAAGERVPVLDTNRLAARIFALIERDGPLVMALAALVIVVTLRLVLRRTGAALLVAGPLFVGVACLPGVMWLFGLSFNFLNVVVLPNLLAIAVDNSVHLFHRFEQEGPGSMPRVLRSTGLTALVATCSNAAGYGALLVAGHGGLRSVGWLALAGVACAFVGTTVLFPALVELKDRVARRRAKSSSSPTGGLC